jgi:predicted phage tail protein
MPIVELPSALRVHADRQVRVTVTARTVKEALEALCVAHPALRAQLYMATGLRRTIGIFVNEEDVRDTLLQELGPRDVVVLITAMAGG